MKNKLMKFLFASALMVVAANSSVHAAPLGLDTEAPIIESSFAFVDYFEFFPDGDLSAFGAEVDFTDGVSTNGFTEIGFGVGFDLADPTIGASGGFDIFDEDGLFLGGNLQAVGFSEDLIEFSFGDLTGAGASSFNSSVLMTVAFDDVLGPNPFDALIDGNAYVASILISNVTDVSTVPAPAVLPLLLSALGIMAWSRRRLGQ